MPPTMLPPIGLPPLVATNGPQQVIASGITDIAYGNGTYVAIGAGGVALTSTDLDIWVSRPNASAYDLHSIIFDGTRFVAVGNFGSVATSTNGISWTGTQFNQRGALTQVLFVYGYYFAVRANGFGFTENILVSYDLVNWGTLITGYGNIRNLFYRDQALLAGTYNNLVLVCSCYPPSTVPLTPTGSLSLAFNIDFTYDLIASGSSARRGVSIDQNKLSIEPHPTDFDTTDTYAGDMWVSPYLSGSGFNIIDVGYSSNYRAKLLTIRPGEGTASAMTRLQSSPRTKFVTVNSVVADNWFVTTEGWQNATWGGGINMPNSESVSVYGSVNFLVPSGSMYVRDTLNVKMGHVSSSLLFISGNLNVIQSDIETSRLYIAANGLLTIEGGSASAQINNADFGTVKFNSSSDAFNFTLQERDGVFYVYPPNTQGAFLRIGGEWRTIYTSSDSGIGNLDGGTFL